MSLTLTYAPDDVRLRTKLTLPNIAARCSRVLPLASLRLASSSVSRGMSGTLSPLSERGRQYLHSRISRWVEPMASSFVENLFQFGGFAQFRTWTQSPSCKVTPAAVEFSQ